MLKRIEVNISDGVRVEVLQQAYSNGDDVLVLDVGEKPPADYEPFTPEPETAVATIKN